MRRCVQVCACRGRPLGQEPGAHTKRLLWEEHQAVTVQRADTWLSHCPWGAGIVAETPGLSLLASPATPVPVRAMMAPLAGRPSCLHVRQMI